MRHLYATVDAFMEAFDNKIVKYIDSHRSQIKSDFEAKAKRDVSEEELDSLFRNLGDLIYDNIELDPNQLERFVNFYVNDQKLGDMVDDVVDDIATHESIYSPNKISTALRGIANKIDASQKPSVTLVIDDLRRILSAVSGDLEKREEQTIDRMMKELHSHLDDLVKTGEMTPEEANEWANRKSEQWKDGLG
jgi:polyhydroxyalkanoate synthesis regulator phasin